MYNYISETKRLNRREHFQLVYPAVFLAEEEKEQRLNATREDTVELLPNTKKHKRELREESDSDASVVVLDTTV